MERNRREPPLWWESEAAPFGSSELGMPGQCGPLRGTEDYCYKREWMLGGGGHTVQMPEQSSSTSPWVLSLLCWWGWCRGVGEGKCPKRGESKEWSFQKIQVEVACLFYLTWESLLPNAIGQSIQRSTQIEWRNRDLAFSWTRESDLLSSFYRSVPLVLSALAKGAGLHS